MVVAGQQHAITDALQHLREHVADFFFVVDQEDGALLRIHGGFSNQSMRDTSSRRRPAIRACIQRA